MTEPDVTLTDYGLALESVLFLVLLNYGRGRPRGIRFWFTIFFASLSAASVLGGTVHGFFLDDQGRGNAILWPSTLVATGVTTLSMWAIGATLLLSPRVVRWVVAAAGLQFALFTCAVLFFTQEFWIAVADNLPAALFLLLAFVLAYTRQEHPSLLLAAAGVALSLVAALLQNRKVGVHEAYFNHNALFHVLQAIALLLMFLGARWLVGADRARTSSLRAHAAR
jgi:hypothetical protein